MANVKKTTNDLYDEYAPIWKKCRDVLAGEDALKKTDLKKPGTYLRELNPSDNSDKNRLRNQSYVKMARFPNYTGVTHSGYMVAYLENDVDGSGTSINQQARMAIDDVIGVGGCGTLVEMPKVEGDISLADVEAGKRASIKFYTRENILDWLPNNPTAKDPLKMVRLREYFQNMDDKGNYETLERNIVLLLLEGKYYQDIYEQKKENGDLEYIERIEVRGSDKAQLNKIPFEFANSVENSPEPDKPLILDLANANLGAYQEDANARTSSFAFSAGTLVVSDDNYQKSKMNTKGKKEPQKLGDSSMLILGSGGKAEILAPPPNPLALEIKKGDREDLVGLGARVIIPGGQAETEETTKYKMGATTSDLSLAVQNVSDMYNTQIRNCLLFMGGEIPDDELYQINLEFFERSMSADDIRAYIELLQAGLLSKSEVQNQLKEGGRIDPDTNLDEMNDELDFSQPAGLELDQE
jgi:hypothetical protein